MVTLGLASNCEVPVFQSASLVTSYVALNFPEEDVKGTEVSVEFSAI